MRLAVFLLFVIGAFATECSADGPVRRLGMREAISHHHLRGRLPETCLISYYELCSGWIWVWSG